MSKYGLILSMMLVCMCTQACIYDEIKDCPDSHPVIGGKYYMSLKFEVKSQKGNGLTTKTFEPTYEDESYERNISDFRIFLVNKEDDSAEVIELTDVPMQDESTTLPFEINREWTHGYLLYVVVNSVGTLDLDLSSAKAFRGTYSRISEESCAQIWQPDHFLMVNSNNEASDFESYTSYWTRNGWIKLEHTDPTPLGGVPVEMNSNVDYTYENPYRVSVKLERVAAKVVVNCDKENFDFSGTEYGNKFYDVHVDGVSLINASNSFNLVQQWKIACYRGPEMLGYDWVKYEKDKLSDGAPFFYPYLWPITPAGDISTIPSQIYYSQISDFTDFDNRKLKDGADSYFSALDANKCATIYCLENASPVYFEFMGNFDNPEDIVSPSREKSALETAMRNRTTGVLFRVRAKFQDDSNNTGDLIVDPDKGSWDTKMKKTSGDDGYRTFYAYNTIITSRLSVLLRDVPTLAEDKGITLTSTVKELRDAGVRVYEGGYMYYIHWIVDQNYKYYWSYRYQIGESYPFNYFAVLRNTRYELNVSKVNEIGMDLPGREFYFDWVGGGKFVEGVNYLLYPIFREDYDTWFSKNDIPNLKNKAI